MCAEPCDGSQEIYVDQLRDMGRRASECNSAVRVSSIERESLSAEPTDTPCGGLETARAPVVPAQRMGGMMAAKSFAAAWSVRRTRELAHQPALCDGEVFTKSGKGLLCFEPAKAQHRVHG